MLGTENCRGLRCAKLLMGWLPTGGTDDRVGQRDGLIHCRSPPCPHQLPSAPSSPQGAAVVDKSELPFSVRAEISPNLVTSAAQAIVRYVPTADETGLGFPRALSHSKRDEMTIDACQLIIGEGVSSSSVLKLPSI